MDVYRPTARNFASESENRIHSDDIAKQFGFEGALVAGVAVFGHMTYPLANALGKDWLDGWSASVRLIKPAYHGDELTIESEETDGGYLVRCLARGGVLLAELTSEPIDEPVSEISLRPGGAAVNERPEVSWNAIVEDEAFPAYSWTPTAEENETYTYQIEDDLPLYAEGILHPHAILSQANRAFSRRFVLPAWIHVGSTVRFRKLVRVGDDLEVHTVPVRKWERKGHEFVTLNIAYVRGEDVVTEIEHTAIFNVAQRAA